MKKILSSLLLLAGLLPLANAQMIVTGGHLRSTAGGMLGTPSDVIVKSGATLNIAATLSCRDLTLLTGSIAKGAGIHEVMRNLSVSGTITAASTFAFRGSLPATVFSSGAQVPNMIVGKTGAVTSVSLASPLTVKTDLKFEVAPGHLLLGNHDLTFLSAATVTGFANTKFVVTNGTGRYIRQAVGTVAKTWHIGATTTTYNPVIIDNTGTADAIGVRCLSDALTGGGSGTPITANAVATSWEVTEAVPGGSNLSFSAKWYASDQLPGFLQTACSVRRHNGSAWDFSPLGAATGTGSAASPYTRVRTGLTDVGYFTVLDGGFQMASPIAENRSENAHEVPGKTPGVLATQFSSDETARVFPNPSDALTRLQLSLAETSTLEVAVFDAQGRLVKRLFGPAAADGGFHEFVWDAAEVSAGAYFFWVKTDGRVRALPVLVQKK